jgi:hypothetical protein
LIALFTLNITRTLRIYVPDVHVAGCENPVFHRACAIQQPIRLAVQRRKGEHISLKSLQEEEIGLQFEGA